MRALLIPVGLDLYAVPMESVREVVAALDLKEFQALFAQEAEIRLSSLGQLMLQLEQDGSDEALIGSIFREVHTLKGSAAVVGFDGVSRGRPCSRGAAGGPPRRSLCRHPGAD
jgi:chemotaxis protein histidine kinase CheA